MKRTLALVYGLLGYVFFFGTFLYAIGFVGSVFVPKSIDNGPQAPLATSVAINLGLLAVFAVQHSVMARQGFKRVWTRIVPPPVERTTYVVAASLALALLLWQWRPMPTVLWDITGTAMGSVLEFTFWLGWGLLLVSTALLNHFELFGLTQVWSYATNREIAHATFKTPSLYKVVRHPLYLGFVIAFWSAPKMTVGHLFFSAACTGYILVGIFFEERDLIASYGKQYLDYSRRVPMLIPFFKRKQAPERVKSTTA